eukprot:TRINITY_DN14986_c0_g1_i1.p1 TRINITY_DN14986_c0_g1~~TRINITY_DN14986_c0_g1_i1.p1  ORF type:complete len:124 (-),score=0.56 TRINITY_DN14986_c0_g1_i1:111-482(-)
MVVHVLLPPLPCSPMNLQKTSLDVKALLSSLVNALGIPTHHAVDPNNTLTTSPAVRLAIRWPFTNFEKKHIIENHMYSHLCCIFRLLYVYSNQLPWFGTLPSPLPCLYTCPYHLCTDRNTHSY